MNTHVTTLLATISLIASYGHSQTLTLPEATRLMLQFEPELNAAEYDTLSTIEDTKVNRAALLPQVALRGSSGVSNRDRATDGLVRSGDTLFQRQLGLSVRQLLSDGGIANHNLKASQNAMKAQQYLEKAMVEARVVDLAEVYMEVIRTEKQISLANDNIANHEKMVSLIKTKLEHGGHRTELQLAQSRLDRSRNLLASLQLGYDRALTRLARLIGTSTFVLSYPEIPLIPIESKAVSLEDNWEYLAAAEALEEAEHRALAAKAQHKPQFYLDAGYNVGRDVIGVAGQDDEARALVVGEWNLFNGGRKKAVEQREHFQVGKFEELKRSADIARHHDMELLWQERNASRESAKILRSYRDDLKNVVSDYEQRFTLGKEQLINILDMQSELYTVSSDLLDSQFDFDTGSFRIKGKQGKLAEWLLRLDDSGSTNLSNLDAKNPQQQSIPVSLVATEELKDQRVPLTQVELMKRKFDGEGPSVDYQPAPMKQYYNVESNSRQGWIKQAWSRWKQKKSDQSKPQASVKPATQRNSSLSKR